MFKGFRDFLLRGNVVDLAVAVMIGAAFNKIVSSIVADLLMPLVGAVGSRPDFSSLVLPLNGSPIKIGSFLNEIISFTIIASVIYFVIVLPMNKLNARLQKPAAPAEPTTKACPECLSQIPLAARRCAHCAQPVD